MDDKQLLGALAQALAPHLGQKVVATGTPSTPYTHGPGGLFGVAGIERDLFHTRIDGIGLSSVFPVRGSVLTDPLFGYVTGYQDVSGTVPDGVCDDPRTAGAEKSCLQTAPFGRYTFKTREAEINRIGQLINRGEFDDLDLVNDPIAPEMGRTIFPNISPDKQLAAGAEILARKLELGIAFANELSRQTYIGDPANNSAGGGHEEFMGLDLLISTNKVDAITGQDCPSLDSDVKDFNYTDVCDENADPDIVRVLTTLWRQVNHIARHTAMQPVRWTFAMRTGLFWELTDCWPCSYLTHRCDFSSDNAEVVVNTPDNIRLRDEMRNGNFLLIDGVRVPVVLDDNIVEEQSGDNSQVPAGCSASDIYLVPLTVRGRIAVTFWQFYDYQQGTMQAVVDGRVTNRFWTDAGMYLWTWDTRNFCLVHEAKIEPRIIMRTPQIAGRLQNVVYCWLQHPRDPQPDDPYFVDDGVTERAAPSLWSDWNAPNRV
jgi:hypothetical protein